jgi:hypothetical protein
LDLSIGATARGRFVPFGRLRRLDVGIAKRFFRGYKLAQSWLDPERKLSILFSTKPDWEKELVSGFALTRHEIAFGEMSPENIRSHDLLVPLTVDALERLQGMRALITDNPIPIPSMASVQLCDDKYLFNQALIEGGFGDFIPRMDGLLRFPYILKKRQGEWSEHIHVIEGARDERKHACELASPEYFRQEIVRGPYEYATHILFKQGRIACSLNIEYAFETETPIKGHDREIYKKVCSCPFLDVFASILASIGFEGLCCFNYKVRDGRPLILEINPRFGGSLCPYFFVFLRSLT